MQIRKVGVVGSGTMGAGIAQVMAQNGFQVLLFDINIEVVNRSISGIHSRVERLVQKGKLSKDEAHEIKQRIMSTVLLSEMKTCQLVIEAAPEKLEIKRDIFKQLDEYCLPGTILATNTSSFSITEIARITKRSQKVIGMHFFNPAPVMSLVEIIKGLRTSEETVDLLLHFARDLKKDPVTCQDSPGFIVNRVARPYYNEALRILGDKIASVEQIDRIMKKSGNFRMGPFELQDMIGIDINYSTTESVYQNFFGDPRFRPHYYQQRMMQSGRHGRKTGGGYYEYDN